MNEFSPLGGNERYAACPDAVYVGNDSYVTQFFVLHFYRFSLRERILVYKITTIYCISTMLKMQPFYPSTVTKLNSARTNLARSAGASSTCVPMRPALTSIWGRWAALSWMTVRNCFFMPTGEQPPWM